MPQPNANALHINAPLTNISVAYTINENAFIASKVFPEIPVDHKADSFWSIPKGAWHRDEARPRPDATESVGSGYDVSLDSYVTIVEAIHKDVGDQARSNADSAFNLDSDATKFVTGRLLIRKEVRFLSTVFKTGVWKDVTGVAAAPTTDQFVQWSDLDDSDPRKDVKAWKRSILLTTGYVPNTLVLGYDVMDVLADHPQFIDRLKYTSADSVDTAMLARIFDVERVFVSSAVINTAKEGNADSFGLLLGKVAWLGYVAPEPGILTPSAGYSFAWRGVSGGLGETVGISKFRMEHLKADRVEGEIAVAPKVVGADLGVFASSVVA